MYEELVKQFGRRACRDEPMSRHTSFRIGGPADLLVDVENRDELRDVLRYAQDGGLALHVIGRGANVLVRDAGIRGVVVRLAGEFRNVSWEEAAGRAKPGGGALLSTLVAESSRRGFGNFCWAAGIPGTIGGAVTSNAGAWGHSTGEFVEALGVMTHDGREVTLVKGQVTFGYRQTLLAVQGIITDVALRLERTPGGEDDPRRSSAEYLARKRETQPLEVPSAGSVFKNPPQGAAGELIDRAGCKGMQQGGAAVSAKHANFIVNNGGATATDVLKLIERVVERVKTRFGVELELEIRVL